MRLVLACDWFLKYTLAQAAAHARAGADVLLLTRDHALEFGGDREERERALEQARSDGVRMIELPGRLWNPAAASALWRARRAIRNFAPDVVHVHDRVDPRCLALLPRVPSVLTVHDPVAHPGQPVAGFTLKRGVLEGSRRHWRRRVAAIIVHSADLAAELEPSERARARVVPHGIDPRSEALPVPPEPTVAFFGRLAPYKGLDVIARAMPLVWEQRPDVRLRVAGSGAAPIELADRRAHIDRRYLPEPEVEAFLRQASLLLLAYTQASQSGAGSLAVGFGVPVLASRLGGLPDLTLDGSYLVEPGDERSLALAILRHVDDGPEVRVRVLSEVARDHSWDTCAARSLEIYESCRRAGPRGPNPGEDPARGPAAVPDHAPGARTGSR